MILEAIVEIPKGSKLKYEHDKETGVLKIDRPISQAIPYNYGYIPSTLCDDKDPLDIFIIHEEAIQPLARVKVLVFGVLRCIDNGEQDDKLLATIVGDDTNATGSRLIVNYLETYKKGFVVQEIAGYGKALDVYNASVDMYNKKVREELEERTKKLLAIINEDPS